MEHREEWNSKIASVVVGTLNAYEQHTSMRSSLIWPPNSWSKGAPRM